MSRLAYSILAVGTLLLPGLAGAQNLQGLLLLASQMLNAMIGLFITLAIVAFFWGLIKYLFSLGGGEGGKNGLQIMLWGVIAIFVMVSIWGIIKLLQNTFRVSDTSINPPRGIQINQL